MNNTEPAPKGGTVEHVTKGHTANVTAAIHNDPTAKIPAAPIAWMIPSRRGKWHTSEGLGGAWALMSPDTRYRYAVRRMVTESPITDPNCRAVFVTLRPLGGDAATSDRAIDRCDQIAARLGAADLVVVGLFGLRAGLLTSADDPVGPGNEDALRAILAPEDGVTRIVIGCWGGSLPGMYRDHVEDLRGALEDIGAKCFGFTSTTGNHPISIMSPTIQATDPLVPLAAAG